MKDYEIINDFLQLRDRAAAVGLTVKVDASQYSIADVPAAKGLVCFDNTKDLGSFIYGYELAYHR